MPAELPPHPSVEHLKKQAKALLRDFRQNEPAAIQKFAMLRLETPPKLSDAQHVIAREYGLDSWAELKERAESLAQQGEDPLAVATKAFREVPVQCVACLSIIPY